MRVDVNSVLKSLLLAQLSPRLTEGRARPTANAAFPYGICGDTEKSSSVASNKTHLAGNDIQQLAA
jgi:hypothetical protein